MTHPTSNEYLEGVRDLVGEMLYEFGWRPTCDAQWSGLAQGLPKLAELLQRHLVGPVVETSSSGWRPIETAPMSRSARGDEREFVLVVYPGQKDCKPDPFVLMAYQDNLGWDTGVWRLHETPTHWMPLPALPSSQETSPRCTCGSMTGLHEFTCGFRRDGDDGKGAVKASEYQTYPGEPITGIYEAGVAIVRLGKDDEATGE